MATTESGDAPSSTEYVNNYSDVTVYPLSEEREATLLEI